MKKLTYSIALLLLLTFSIASCKKDGALPPVIDSTKSVQPTCDPDATKLVSYVINNITGKGAFNVVFSGSNNYVFNIPANASTTVVVKQGTYSISIYPPGNNSEYNDYVEYPPYNKLPIKESGATINNVSINSCTVPQDIEITQ